MSRTYSNFLLFESVLDNLPEGYPVMTQAVNTLLNPTITLVEEDCGTYLGKIVDTTNEIQGFVEVASKEPLTIQRINQLLGMGQYQTGIRTIHTCQSYSKGGVCRMCYNSTLFRRDTTTPIGSTIQVPALQVYQTDVIRGDGHTANFPLSQTFDDWYGVVVVHEGGVVDESEYSLDYDSITFNTTPGSDWQDDVYNVHFLQQNSDPLLGYISTTYSGALLGTLPLPTLELFLRTSLYENLFSDSMVSLLIQHVNDLAVVPSTYKDYLEAVHGKMERILLALYLFAIYVNVQV